jgi:hypothetical protein
MKQKELYTFEELCEELEITMSAFSKRADVDEGTIARIRKGYPARSSTVNKLLRNFSEVYGFQLSRDNVLPWAEKQSATHEQVTIQPVEAKQRAAMPQKEVAQNRPTIEKRAYKPRKESGLPEGAIPATEFGLAHSIKRETFRDHMNTGLGPGLIHGPGIPEDTSVGIKDWVRYEERPKRVRKDGTIEKERYLTSDQQAAALAFWRRHDVTFIQCDRTDCTCHNP